MVEQGRQEAPRVVRDIDPIGMGNRVLTEAIGVAVRVAAHIGNFLLDKMEGPDVPGTGVRHG